MKAVIFVNAIATFAVLGLSTPNFEFAPARRMTLGEVTVIKGSPKAKQPGSPASRLKKGSTIFVGDTLAIASGEKVWIKQRNGIGRQFFKGQHVVRYLESDTEKVLAGRLSGLPRAAKSRSTEGFMYPGDEAVSAVAFGVLLKIEESDILEAKITDSGTTKVVWEGKMTRSESGFYESRAAQTALSKMGSETELTLEIAGLSTSMVLASGDVQGKLFSQLRNAESSSEVSRIYERALAFWEAKEFSRAAENLSLLAENQIESPIARERLSELIREGYWATNEP